MMKKIMAIAALAVFLGFILLLVSCDPNANGKNDSINIVSVNPKPFIATEYGERDAAAEAVARGANDFAFRLAAALSKNIGSKNFVCSPYSVWLPLAALVNATDTQNKEALITALGASGITEEDINRASSRMLYNLTNSGDIDEKDYHNPLKIANAIFVGENVTLKREFAQTFMDYYRGSSINVDFSSRDAVDAVNRWASDNTNGLIKNLIQEFDPNTVAAIANAIYFSDRWSWEFNTSQTKEDVFHAPAGDGKAFYMLREGDRQIYYEDDKVQAMPLWFKKNGGMYILLPKEGSGSAAEFLSSMTNEYFDKISSDSYMAEGKLLLPRFSIENDIEDLKKTLIDLGVPLFDPLSAPITGLLEENIPVFLTDAIQRAIIKVDEKGTTAAAVTVITGDGAAGPPEPAIPFEMICNRPFVFILFDYTYDCGRQILFTGIVNQP